MFSSTPLILLLSLLLFTRQTLGAFVQGANVFTGCANTLPGSMTVVSNNGNPNGFTSATQCNYACVGVNGATHSYYQPSTNSCQCTTKYQYPRENNYGNPDACGKTTDWDTRLTGTSYTFVGCYTSRPTGLTNVPKTGPNGCLLTCGKSLQAGFFITTEANNNNYGCYCGGGAYTVQTQCGPGTYFLFQHSVTDASQGLARRRMTERYDRRQKKYQPCPGNMTACVIPGFSVDTYECIDTTSDLESCGGCLQATYHSTDAPIGQDCSKNAAVGRSTCLNGQCVIGKCKRGYTLLDGRCEKTSKLVVQR